MLARAFGMGGCLAAEPHRGAPEPYSSVSPVGFPCCRWTGTELAAGRCCDEAGIVCAQRGADFAAATGRYFLKRDPLDDRGADRPVEGEGAARDGDLARQSGHPVADFRANFKVQGGWIRSCSSWTVSCSDELSGSAAGHARTIAFGRLRICHRDGK